MESLAFKYLWLLARATLNREGTCEPLVKLVVKRLGFWRFSLVNLGGNHVLLNSVTKSILVYFLSFIKILMMTWKKLDGVWRCFLWGCQKVG